MSGSIRKAIVTLRPIWIVILFSFLGMVFLEFTGLSNEFDELWIVGVWAASSIACLTIACLYVFFRWLAAGDKSSGSDK